MNAKKMHFEISERKLLLRIFDILAVFVMLFLVERISHFDYLILSGERLGPSIILAIYLMIIGSVFEMYNLQVASNQFQITRSIMLTASVTVLIYLLTPVYTPLLPSNRIQILYFYLSVLGALFIWRSVYVRFLASQRFLKKAVLICDGIQLEELVAGLNTTYPHYTILGYVNTDSQRTNPAFKGISEINPSDLTAFARKNSVSEVVVASQKTDGITTLLYNQLIHMLEGGFIIREYTQVYEEITQRIPVQYVSQDFYRYFPFSRSNQNHLYLLIIRILEIIFSITGILIGLTILPFIVIGNLLGNRGKLFYTQERVGKNGEVFNILKLRTMVKNAEVNGAVFTTTNDARITPFGKFMRKARLDEFPQFVNILKGDMGVIGPRPERPVFVNEIAEVMPFYETRHVIKPGLTGWAQVNYSYGDSISDSLMKLQYDLYYIKHRSIFLDVNIVIKTLSTVLFYRGQ